MKKASAEVESFGTQISNALPSIFNTSSSANNGGLKSGGHARSESNPIPPKNLPNPSHSRKASSSVRGSM